jgi:hypothetical protein
VVTPAATTLGLYDIHYDAKLISLDGGSTYSLASIIEEVAHTEQFLQVWGGLKRGYSAKYGVDSTDYDSAKTVWGARYLYHGAKGGGYNNDVEKWAKDKVDSIINELKRDPQRLSLCGFRLDEPYK